MAAVVGRLPAGPAAWLGSCLGDVAYALMASRRRRALDNLRQAFPEFSEERRRDICRGSWRHLGVMLGELCAVSARPLAALLADVTIDGNEHLEAVMARHGRALLLTAHLGNWEMLTVANGLVGYPLAVVVRPLDSGLMNTVAERLRRKTGVEIIDKRDALRPVLGALRRGRLVGILLDQNTARRESVFVPFFGRAASTSRSIAVLALRTETPVVPVFIRRTAPGCHRVTIHPPVPAPEGMDREAAIVELTARCTAAIEAAIREVPEQWLWMHDRWRTKLAEADRG